MTAKLPNRDDLDPGLKRLTDLLDPIGWSPDDPSPECKKVLTPPSRVRQHRGMDRLGLIWRWVRWKVMAKLAVGSNISDASNLDYARIAYMHTHLWAAEACDHSLLTEVDLIEEFESICRWDVDRCRPSADAFVKACIARGQLMTGPQYEPGLTAAFLDYESGVIPFGQHLSALRSGFRMHNVKDLGQLDRRKAEADARKDVSNEETASAWLDTLGGAAELGYFKDSRFLLSSWEIHKKLRAAFGVDREERRQRDVSIAPIVESDADPSVLADDVLIEVKNILGITADMDLADLDLAAAARRQAAKGVKPAVLAARLHLLLGGSRSRIAKFLNVSESEVRKAERSLE